MADRFYSWFKICDERFSYFKSFGESLFSHVFSTYLVDKYQIIYFLMLEGRGKKHKSGAKKNKCFISSARDWIVCAL